MAGTLTISTLSDGTNSTSSTNCIQGSAKAWVNFNGTTSPGTIRASYNVGSVTKNGTGDYTLNFTNALADANYAVIGAEGGTGGYGVNAQYITAPTTSAVRVGCWGTTGAFLDQTYVNFAIFR